MAARFLRITDDSALEATLARSHEGPVVLFKHDPGCGSSQWAYQTLTRIPGEIALVDVQAFHHLGQAVAARTGVRHESPQVLVLRDGDAVWAASHGAIAAEAVEAAVRGHA
jgi:bacillithiol system protein YtxJ